MDSAALRFADYATSGAFQIGLTRTQISSLMQIAAGDHDIYPGMATFGALERKGLVHMVEASGRADRAQLRPTAAGLLVAQLCSMAGLTNSAAPDLAEAVDRLTEEIAAMRIQAFQMAEDSWSLKARLEESEMQRTTLQAEKAGGYWPQPMVRLKDRQPDRPVAAMTFMQMEPEHG